MSSFLSSVPVYTYCLEIIMLSTPFLLSMYLGIKLYAHPLHYRMTLVKQRLRCTCLMRPPKHFPKLLLYSKHKPGRRVWVGGWHPSKINVPFGRAFFMKEIKHCWPLGAYEYTVSHSSNRYKGKRFTRTKYSFCNWNIEISLWRGVLEAL